MPGIKYFQRCLDITEGRQHVGRAPEKSPYDSSSLSSTFEKRWLLREEKMKHQSTFA